MPPTDSFFPIGYGTGPLTDERTCVENTKRAIEIGYRHIDTAQMYENEAYVGRAIEESLVDRDELFVATKIHPKNLGYEDAIRSAKESLDRLGVDSVDLLYVHWPVMSYDVEDTAAAFDELCEQGYVDHIGVSNFTHERLTEFIDSLHSPLFAHQIEMHPLLPQQELLHAAQEHDHYVVAYSPLARANVLELDILQKIADEHGCTPAQISLAWLLSKSNVVAIPSSTNDDHLRANLESSTIELNTSDIQQINRIEKRERIIELDYDQMFR